jgi:hypothetical protein
MPRRRPRHDHGGWPLLSPCDQQEDFCLQQCRVLHLPDGGCGGQEPRDAARWELEKEVCLLARELHLLGSSIRCPRRRPQGLTCQWPRAFRTATRPRSPRRCSLPLTPKPVVPGQHTAHDYLHCQRTTAVPCHPVGSQIPRPNLTTDGHSMADRPRI